jgi:gliding motility-associated-like protein
MVLVNAAPVPDAGPDTTVCFGGQIYFTGSGGIQYHWTPSRNLSNPDVYNPAASGLSGPADYQYSLSVIDANGCQSLKNDTMTLHVPPPAELFAGWDTAVAISQPVQLHATDINQIGFIHYSWSPGNSLNNPFIPNPVAILTDSVTQFIVTASTSENCTGKDTVIVRTYLGPQIYVASAFTPNGDGNNDVLKAFPVGIKSFGYFRVFNRFGQLVFSTNNENIGWDGRFKGAMQTMNTFVWIATAIDYKGNFIQRKGTTTIIP